MKSLALLFAALLSLAAFGAEKQDRITYTDPAGDITADEGDEHPTDVVGVTLSSDGTFVIAEVTLAEASQPKSLFQALLLGLAFDVDNSPKSGGQGFGGMHGDVPGIDFESEMLSSFEDGALSKSASASVIRVENNGNQSNVIDSTDAPHTPAKGKTYTGKIAYADLGVKSGQTIKVIARELNDRGPEEGMFPAAMLTLR